MIVGSSTTRFVPDQDTDPAISGVDRHFYERQVGAASPFDATHAFRLAAARAKDKARHELIRAVQKADEDARQNRGLGRELGDVLAGNPTGAVTTRTIEGVAGASDDAIKL